MPTQLEQLKKLSLIVADSGDFETIKEFQPVDATTNPSLVYQAAQKPEYRHLIATAIQEADKALSPKSRRDLLIDSLFVSFGVEILKTISGRVSTEVDAALSFDTQKSIERARQLISLYESRSIPRERVLIKLAATWEGVQAGEILEMEGIHTNMTLIFSLPQAIACLDARATLISPFVGRILDWHAKKFPTEAYSQETDPGVIAVKTIYNYAKKFNYKTLIMGASFRNTDEILGLAGCDLLTISPKLLSQLNSQEISITQKLSIEQAKEQNLEQVHLTESSFRYAFNKNAMAVEKLAEGIRNFVTDTERLENFITTNFDWQP